MSRKPRTTKATNTTDSFKEAIKFVSLVCSDKGPVNETHIYLGGHWAAASNGILTIACPIQSEIYACPNADLLQKALAKCGQSYKVNEPFTVISTKFKAIIPIVEPILLSITPPDNPTIEINDVLRIAFETVSVLVNDNAQRIYGASILLNGKSVIATENGSVLFEYWHGLDLPKDIAIPKNIVKVLSNISKKLTRMGYSDNSITLYFDDLSWIKTQLFAEKWPDVTEVLNKPSNQAPLPKDFWEGVEAVAPFSPDGTIWFAAGMVRSHAQEGAGASFEVGGIPPGLSFSARQLLLLKPLADTIDFFTPSGVGTMLTFQGNRVRGAIAGRSQ